MIKAIFFKEWLKIRWVVFGAVLLALGFLTYIGLNLRQYFKMNDPINVWIYFIQRKVLYYSILKFIPAFIAVILAIAQFTPEMVKKRYRLTFHLPYSETKSILLMSGIGLLIVLLVAVILLVGLAIIGSNYFPAEVTYSSLITVLPWLLASITVYLATSAIVLDPSWKYRILYALFFIPFIQSLFLEHGYLEYQYSLTAYFLVSLLFGVVILFPGYRLRKGSVK
ncbi:MAG: hypothetical protein DRP96_04815 [Candidatus Neomarinimicrobiota bacterium]|nr:MAG: hypothetical protein DRP96_04815 [Candidatus Neomarinimicrobiota bacterium]